MTVDKLSFMDISKEETNTQNTKGIHQIYMTSTKPGHRKYIDINSSGRDRGRYPLASRFSVPVSSSGDRTNLNAIDPVATSTPEIVFNFAFNRISLLPTVSGTIEQVVGIGALTSSQKLIIQVGANTLFRELNYYAGAVLQKGTEVRRVAAFRFLNTSTNYTTPSQKSDRALITIVNSFSTLTAGETVVMSNPSDLSDGLFPLIFVPTGADTDNYYRNYTVYNQSTHDHRPVLFYDGASRMLHLDTGSSGGVGWSTKHTLALRQTLPMQTGIIDALGTATTVVLPNMLDINYVGGFVRISASPSDLRGEFRRIISEDAGTKTLTVDSAFSTVPGSAVTNGVFRDSAFTVINGTKEAIATLTGDYSWLGISTQFKIGNASGILQTTTFAVTAIIPPSIYESGDRTTLITALDSGGFSAPFNGSALVNGNTVDGLNNINPGRAIGSYLSFAFAEPIVITGVTLYLGSALPAVEAFKIQGVAGPIVTDLVLFSNVTSVPFTVDFPNTQVYAEYRLVASTGGSVIVSIHEINFTVSTTFVRYTFDTVPPSAVTYTGGTTSPGAGHFYEIVSFPTYYEILPFTTDNVVSIDFSSHLTKSSEFEIRLLSLTLPNHVLKSSRGGRLVDYPYFYVELSNPSMPTTNLIYSNNRNAAKAMFKVPVLDVAEVWRSSYIKLSSPEMPQRFKLNLQDGVEFSVRTPDGKVIETIVSERFSPSPPNSLTQISATFSIEPLFEESSKRGVKFDQILDGKTGGLLSLEVDALEGYAPRSVGVSNKR